MNSKKLLGAFVVLFLLHPLGVSAQPIGQTVNTIPSSRIATNVSSTIGVTGTFQTLWASQDSRVNCLIQNNGSNTMWVYTGTGTPTAATSMVLAPGASVNCANSGIVDKSLVAITGTAGDAFFASLDGAPEIGPATTVATTAAPSSASTAGITAISTEAANDDLVLKSAPGNLYSLYVTTGGTAGYLMVFNATSAPVDGAVLPVHCVVAAANATSGLSFGEVPGVFSTGITAVFSSTGCFTKTASATAFISGSVK